MHQSLSPHHDVHTFNLHDDEIAALQADSKLQRELYESVQDEISSLRPDELSTVSASIAEDSNPDRRSFFQRLLVGAAAASVPAVMAAKSANAGVPTAQQIVDLQALLLVLRKSSRNVPQFFLDLQTHENDHVDFLLGALGSAARPKPTFQNLMQGSFNQFLQVTQALENTGVGAYLGAAPNILSRSILAAAGSIATVEARHAGTINVLLGDRVVPNNNSFDQPLTPMQVGQAAGGFIASLNGGSPLNYSTTPSAQNDTAILNFALALEFLEAEFYNINVPLYVNGSGQTPGNGNGNGNSGYGNGNSKNGNGSPGKGSGSSSSKSKYGSKKSSSGKSKFGKKYGR